MKKILMALVMVVCAVTFAQAEVRTTTLTRDVTVKGDATRARLVSGLVGSYFADTRITPVEDNSQGEYVVVVGPGGAKKIHFSPKLVERLEKLAANPRAGDGLMNICPSQARDLIGAVGPMRVTMEEMKKAEKVSPCDNGGCYNGRILTGSYQTLQPFEGVRLVSNTGNHKYPENSVTFKMEYHKAGHPGWRYGTGWGPTIVLRNVTMENPLQLVTTNAGCILPYLERITALSAGRPGKEGDSCYEVVLLRDGTLYKDESPAEARFGKM